MNFDDMGQLSDDDALAYLERSRWPNGPICPHCGSTDVVRLRGASTRHGVLKCRRASCRKQFRVTVGTIFASCHLTPRLLLQAIVLLCGRWSITPFALHRQLGVTYKTARRLCSRIRYAMRQSPLAAMIADALAAEDELEAEVNVGMANQAWDNWLAVAAP